MEIYESKISHNVSKFDHENVKEEEVEESNAMGLNNNLSDRIGNNMKWVLEPTSL